MRLIQPVRAADYRWVLAWTLAFTEMTSWGILYYTFSILLTPMQHEFGWPVETLTGAFSAALLISGVASIFVGRWLARSGARVVMTLGSCCAVAGVLMWSTAQTVLQFYVAWGLIGLAMAGILYDPAFAVIARWFPTHRSRALTVLTFGGGLASVVYVPLSTALWKTFGWRSALLVLAGILTAATLTPHLLLLRKQPDTRGQIIVGQAASSEKTTHPVFNVLSKPNFWWLTLAFALTSFVSAAISVHLVSYLTGRGFVAENASLAVSVIGGSQIIGRLLLTPLSERFSQRWLIAVMFGMGSVALLILISQTSEVSVLIFAVLLGAGYGASSPARALLVGDLFGVAHYAEINGIMAFLLTFARAAGPTGAGLFLSFTHNYTAVFLFLMLLAMGGALATLLLKFPHRTN